MTIEKLSLSCEAILFAAGEPVEAVRIAEALGEKTGDVLNALKKLADDLENTGRAVKLVKLGEKYQLCTKSEFAGHIRAVLDLKKNIPLSNAAFEVLAVVAYNQPVTKSYIEQVRGVDCTGVVSSLCQKGLIEERGRLDLPGKPLLYGTTPNFLRCFCLTSLADLPELPAKDEALLPDGEIDNELGVQVRSFFEEEINENSV
ncbi:MAG: SMC-Scp complex subunit ScpB [Clostridiales bacterium]|nr:SMC-Scp complex subunit ScpB [Clostridiales bacterium]